MKTYIIFKIKIYLLGICISKVRYMISYTGIHVNQQDFYWRNSWAHSIITVCMNMRHLQSWKLSWNGRINFWVESLRWSLTTKALNISRPNQTCCRGGQGGGNIFPASITIPSMQMVCEIKLQTVCHATMNTILLRMNTPIVNSSKQTKYLIQMEA